jgi:hypothetical protein
LEDAAAELAVLGHLPHYACRYQLGSSERAWHWQRNRRRVHRFCDTYDVRLGETLVEQDRIELRFEASEAAARSRAIRPLVLL